MFYGVNVSGGTDDEGNEIPTIYPPVYETAGLKGSLRIGRLSAILPTISSIT